MLYIYYCKTFSHRSSHAWILFNRVTFRYIILLPWLLGAWYQNFSASIGSGNIRGKNGAWDAWRKSKTQSQEDGEEMVHKCFFSLNRSSRGLDHLRRQFLCCGLVISMTEWWGTRDITFCICNCTCTCAFIFLIFLPGQLFLTHFSAPPSTMDSWDVN